MTIQTTNRDVLPFITAYGPKNRSQIIFPAGTGRTKQAHKAECDINNILARFKRTGVLDFQQQHEPQYADVTALDYQTAMLTVARANTMFADMPAHLRARFDNSPAQFLAFVNDERNQAEAQELGLLKNAPEAAVAVPGGTAEKAPEEPKTNSPT